MSDSPFKFPEGVKALSFDIWLTLLNGNKAFTRPRLQLIFDMLGVPITDMEAVVAAYKASDKYYNLLMEETGRDFGFSHRIGMMFRDLKVMRNMPYDHEVDAIQRAVGQLRSQPEYRPTFIEPDLPETLKALMRKGYYLGLLSNTGMDDRAVMEPVLKALGIWDLFDVAIFTSEDGRAKPNPELFLHMAKSLYAKPGEVLHIGDNVVADWEAHKAGLHAVVYAPKGKEGYPFITSMKELLTP
jgi:HAD superfamily hydrolase (TIGR01549 family)